MEYEFHSYCTLFPQADEKTLTDISADIKENGLNEPIILYEGKILDGRNRYLACGMAGVEPTFKNYTGDEPLQYVVSKNLHRRHLNESQRAMLGQKLWKMAHEGESPAKVTQEDISKQFNVSPASVRSAARLAEVAIDEIKDKVEAGTLSINKAADLVKKAQKISGVKSKEGMPEEEKAKLKEAQTKLLNEEVDDIEPTSEGSTAEEFNQAVLSGVYDGKRYRRDVQEIQSTIAKMESLPTLFEDAVSMIGALEQEKMLIAMVDMMVATIKKASKKFSLASISYDEVLSTVAALMDEKFKLPETEPAKERELLEELKQRYQEDCATYLKDAAALKKRIKAGGAE